MILESGFPPDVRVENEARFLISNGYSVTILCSTRDKNIAAYEKINGIKVYRVYQSNLNYKLSALALLLPFYFHFWKKSIENYIENHNVDIIHLHDLPLIKVVNKISKRTNIPFIADFHENRPEIMKHYSHTNSLLGKILISNKSWQRYQLKYARLVQKLILVTPEAKDYYVKQYGVDEKKIFVVPNYADINSLRSIEIDSLIVDKYSSRFSLVYFGDTGLRRGTMTIIEAADLLKTYDDINFIIIGNSKEQQILESEIIKRDLQNIELTGYLHFDKIISFLKASNVGLCPFIKNDHHDTTYANKMFQTMYFGKPIIASNCASQENLLLKENAGIIFESGNAKDLSNKILQLKNNKALLKQMSDNSSEAIKNKYNTEIGNYELLKLYKSIDINTHG